MLNDNKGWVWKKNQLLITLMFSYVFHLIRPISPHGNCTGEIYIGECVEWWQRTMRKNFTARAHSTIPNFFPNYFPPCHAQRLVWALRVNHQIFPPFVPYTLPKYLAMPIPPHVVWKTVNATPEANGQMLFPGAHFCSNIGILTISQVSTHDY